MLHFFRVGIFCVRASEKNRRRNRRENEDSFFLFSFFLAPLNSSPLAEIPAKCRGFNGVKLMPVFIIPQNKNPREGGKFTSYRY